MLGSVVRPALAVAVMAATLFSAGLGWTSADHGNAELGIDLCMAVVLGALVYTGSIFALWLALGRPAGAEADALAIIKKIKRGTRS
jgi:hypothetical protein